MAILTFLLMSDAVIRDPWSYICSTIIIQGAFSATIMTNLITVMSGLSVFCLYSMRPR